MLLAVALLLCHGLLGTHHMMSQTSSAAGPAYGTGGTHVASQMSDGGGASHGDHGVLALCAEYFAAFFKTFASSNALVLFAFLFIPSAVRSVTANFGFSARIGYEGSMPGVPSLSSLSLPFLQVFRL